jgi:hypothetical protein
MSNIQIEIPISKFQIPILLKLLFLLEFGICSLEFKNNTYICTHNFAGMVKLVDMPDLGSGAARRVGSSPITRTRSSIMKVIGLFLCMKIFLKL